MNTFTLFKNALFHFSRLRQAKHIPFWKVIFYVIFLSALLALPLTTQFFSVMQEVNNDAQKIIKKLPDFAITDGHLTYEKPTQGFIYQTNAIIFTFDPDGKRTPSDLSSDVVGNTIGLGLLQNSLVIALPNSGTVDSLLGSNQIEIAYDKGSLDGLSRENLKQALTEYQVPFGIKLLIFGITLYPAFINLIINLLIIALVGNLYAKIRLYQLRFLDCLKIAVYCATLPVIISSTLHFAIQTFDEQFLIIFVSLFIFFRTLHNEERKKLPIK